MTAEQIAELNKTQQKRWYDNLTPAQRQKRSSENTERRRAKRDKVCIHYLKKIFLSIPYRLLFISDPWEIILLPLVAIFPIK